MPPHPASSSRLRRSKLASSCSEVWLRLSEPCLCHAIDSGIDFQLKLLLLFFPVFFSWVLFPRPFISSNKARLTRSENKHRRKRTGLAAEIHAVILNMLPFRVRKLCMCRLLILSEAMTLQLKPLFCVFYPGGCTPPIFGHR